MDVLAQELSHPYGPNYPDFDVDIEEDDVEVEEVFRPRNKRIKINKGGNSGGTRGGFSGTKTQNMKRMSNFFSPSPVTQPTIKSALTTKEALHKAHMATTRWLYDTCVPLNSVNSKIFQPMFDPAIAIGPGYKVPTYHNVRVNLLRDSKKEVHLFVESLRSQWADTGCTIMGDGWTDGAYRTLINFLVYSPRGIVFIKFVDASDVVKSGLLLFALFEEMIQWVGASNVFHMVTDNGSNYILAEKMVTEHYKTINWSPCVAHCLNLILQDIAKMEHVLDLALKTSKVTRYVYNHIWVLAWLRKRKD